MRTSRPRGGYDGPAAKPLIEIGEPAIDPQFASTPAERDPAIAALRTELTAS